jgi:hypothetical protein
MAKPIQGAKWIAVLALALSAVQANADVVNITDDQWHAFDVDELVSGANGLKWISLDGSALSFTLSLATPAYLTVLDGGFAGDQFRVFDNGTELGLTSAPGTSYPLSHGLDFDAALADTSWSRAVFFLGAGNHSITGLLTASALDEFGDAINATVGAVRVAPVPLPAALLLFLSGSGLLGLFRKSASANSPSPAGGRG